MNAPTKARRRILTADPARGRRTRTPDGPFRRPPISIHMTQAEFDAEAARLFRLRARHPGRASRDHSPDRRPLRACRRLRQRGPSVSAAPWLKRPGERKNARPARKSARGDANNSNEFNSASGEPRNEWALVRPSRGRARGIALHDHIESRLDAGASPEAVTGALVALADHWWRECGPTKTTTLGGEPEELEHSTGEEWNDDDELFAGDWE